MGEGPKVDSAVGIQMLMEWARAHKIYLNEAHEDIAKKYGVSTEGVFITRPIPAPHQRSRG